MQNVQQDVNNFINNIVLFEALENTKKVKNIKKPRFIGVHLLVF